MSDEGGAFVTPRAAELLALTELLSPHMAGGANRLAELMSQVQAADALLEADVPDEGDKEWLRGALRQVSGERIDHWRREIGRLHATMTSIVTLFDVGYPSNLRLIHNRPPVLFIRGRYLESDARAVAIVGTRAASDEGVGKAVELARQLSERQITVVSGLAQGIDTAAHSGAVNSGGRTIAVFGTGIDLVHPVRNRSLARAIERSGACVSQYWPSQRGAKWTFPLRNIVTSGLSLGTVVVEASETSGARLQANDARLHGKRLFLMRTLLEQPWAREMAADDPGVTIVDDVDDVVRAVEVDLCVNEPELVF